MKIEHYIFSHSLAKRFKLPISISSFITSICLWYLRIRYAMYASYVCVVYRKHLRPLIYTHFSEFFKYNMYYWAYYELYGPSFFFDCSLQCKPYFDDRVYAVLFIQTIGLHKCVQYHQKLLDGLSYPMEQVGLLLPPPKSYLFTQLDLIMNYYICTECFVNKESDLGLIRTLCSDLFIIPKVHAIVEDKCIMKGSFPNAGDLHVKPSIGSKGCGHFQINYGILKTEELLSKFPNQRCLVTERVKNCATFQNLTNCNGLCTLRILTFCFNSKAYLFGIKGRVPTSQQSVTDNTSATGVGFAINENEYISSPAEIRNKFKGSQYITHHPITHIKFEGTFIPGVMKATEYVLLAHERLCNHLNNIPMYIGWDVALTDDCQQPIYIEHNHGAWVGAQATVGNFMSKYPQLQTEILHYLS